MEGHIIKGIDYMEDDGKDEESERAREAIRR